MNAPEIGKKVYLDPSAQIIGRVKIGDHSSVWPGAVLRGDINRIEIGHYTNIQDLTVIHVDYDRPCLIGNYVTVGHQVCLHACTVGDCALIGMGSILLDGAVVGEETLLGAGSLVTSGETLKPRSLYFGRPAKWVRDLGPGEIRALKKSALDYADGSLYYLQGRIARITDGRKVVRPTKRCHEENL
jgi:carbonic anhydrase/acetyltransferase-like protein (isoleucine patch superfamily)